jgi:hypothetical protein
VPELVPGPAARRQRERHRALVEQDEPEPDELLQVGRDLGRLAGPGQRLRVADVEPLADDRRRLDHRPPTGAQALQTGQVEQPDPGRDRAGLEAAVVGRLRHQRPFAVHVDQQVVVLEAGHALLDHQRIPLRLLGDERLEVRVHPVPEQVPDELLALPDPQRRKVDQERVWPGARPAGVVEGQLVRAGDRQQHDRDVLQVIGQILDRIEQDGRGPLHVVDHHHQRPAAGDRPQQALQRPERALGQPRAAPEAEHLRQPLGHELAPLLVPY